MLFRKKIEKACAYCKHSAPADEGTVICPKKGIMSKNAACGGFCYDPLKRIPEAESGLTLPVPEDADFSL